MRPTHLNDWSGDKFPLLTNEQIDDLPPDERQRYVERLHAHQIDNGWDDSPWYRQWRDHEARCRTEECTGKRFESHPHCLKHLNLDEIDPLREVHARAIRSKLRMAELLECAVDQLETILNAPPDEVSSAIRLKAVSEVFDRAHLPRQTAQSVALSGTMEVVNIDAASVIQARLDRLAGSVVSGALTAPQDPQNPPNPQEGRRALETPDPDTLSSPTP